MELQPLVEELQKILENIEKKNKKPQKVLKPTQPKKRATAPKLVDFTSPPQRGLIPRDFMEMMEVPFLALSKNRTTPIIYENPKKGVKVRVTRHTEHFLASIYDWDIIIFVASKMQEILNNGSDIPPRTMTFPRHEILKALGKHDETKQHKDLDKSLLRLKTTLIETTIRNEDYRYEVFGFLDSWKYTKRKDIKEISITLSQWLYNGICAKSSLLKVSNEYFDITSGLKRFLYRTARKHVGNNKDAWEFSLEKLYEKSGSEREFRKFKSDLKAAANDNDLPEYNMIWVERNKKSFISFLKKNGKPIIEVGNAVN